MDKVFKIFRSFEEAEQDDDNESMMMTPESMMMTPFEHLQACFQIRQQHFALNNIDPKDFSLRKLTFIETVPFPEKSIS